MIADCQLPIADWAFTDSQSAIRTPKSVIRLGSQSQIRNPLRYTRLHARFRILNPSLPFIVHIWAREFEPTRSDISW